MSKAIGVLIMEHVAVGVVENNRVVGPIRVYPEAGQPADLLLSMPAADIADCVAKQIETVLKANSHGDGGPVAIGLGVPGIVQDGVLDDSPNLPQLKGFDLQGVLTSSLKSASRKIAIRIFNDADATAAGVAATRGQLHKLIRVWTVGSGVGFGRYPWTEGVWEGGHSTVTLDPKENFCGCGGRGHLEGFLGYRAMRLRFLDMEPEEIFANARSGDQRCADFMLTCHRALAAATATSIHMEGSGQFYITGQNAGFIDVNLLDRTVHEMVKMSPLQGSRFESIPPNDELGIIGAAVNAERQGLS
jgi:glucokinase